MERGEFKFTLLTICMGLICLTILATILCITLWEYRIIVGSSLLILLLMGGLSWCIVIIQNTIYLCNSPSIQQHRNKRKRILMETIQLGDSTICVQDDEFKNGYQAGYLQFITHYRAMRFTDLDVYTWFLGRILLHPDDTNRYNAGYIVGLIKGLLEQNPTAPLRTAGTHNPM